ncbi:phage scaffolding protein [Lysinibacillus sp. NPDC058147]|uniref:phage scaffolding protein n=1 Tax=unclassified Lysinibacillus TaxID=2636778 RepID=UPI0036DEB00E
MKKEDLIALGLSEEQADKVIEGYGQMIPKSRLNEKIEELRVANETIGERDNQIADLIPKAAGHESLQNEITNLQQANQTAKEQYDADLAKTRLVSAMKLGLTGKVHDVDIVLSQLDQTKIELDEQGNVKAGLDDQLTTLKESKSFLFVADGLKGKTPPAGTPPKPQTLTRADFAKKPYEERLKLMQDNPSLLSELQ